MMSVKTGVQNGRVVLRLKRRIHVMAWKKTGVTNSNHASL